MAAVLDNKPCTACGGRHTLCHPDTDILVGARVYEYECPKAGKTVRLPFGNAWNRVELLCPPDAVPLRDAN
jgi:hypothetical protein